MTAPLVVTGQGTSRRAIVPVEARAIIDTPEARLAALHARLRRRWCVAGLVASLVALAIVASLVAVPGVVWLAAGVGIAGLFIAFYPGE